MCAISICSCWVFATVAPLVLDWANTITAAKQRKDSDWKPHGLILGLCFRACLSQWLPWLCRTRRARLSPMGAISCWCSQSFPVGLRVCPWDSPEGCSTKTWWDKKFGQKRRRDKENCWYFFVSSSCYIWFDEFILIFKWPWILFMWKVSCYY